MNWKDDVFTLDNLWHVLVAVSFTVALGWFLPFDPVYALLAGIGLYLREVSQVRWDFTLKGSAHKHLEWITATICAFLASFVMLVVR
jgi:hypothetical protein